ncbi:hypothetical protein pb186bvf_011913 [Paramecium bursaria]
MIYFFLARICSLRNFIYSLRKSPLILMKLMNKNYV